PRGPGGREQEDDRRLAVGLRGEPRGRDRPRLDARAAGQRLGVADQLQGQHGRRPRRGHQEAPRQQDRDAAAKGNPAALRRLAAGLMRTGYNLFRDAEFRDFAAIRAALEEQLGDLGPTSKSAKKKIKLPKGVEKPAPLPPEEAAPAAAKKKGADMDFDDYE